jgi:MFS transporter, ACS family, aldohexuronate transporter
MSSVSMRSAGAGTKSITGLRWHICALLFFATTINYIDRQVFSILAPDLQKSIGWNEVEYGYIVTAFQAAYATGYFFIGRVMDSISTRKGFAIIIGLWSFAAMAHAAARSGGTRFR